MGSIRGPYRSVSEAYDGTDVFGASWEEFGGVGWISENRKIHRGKNRKIPENQEVADGARQGSVCGRMGGDRSVSEACDDTDGFGGFWEDFWISDFRGFRSETSF